MELVDQGHGADRRAVGPFDGKGQCQEATAGRVDLIQIPQILDE